MLAYSQALREPVSARYVGLGAYSNHFSDVFSFTANQASLTKAKTVEAGLYSERKFLLDVASFYQGVLVIPSKKGNVGVEASYFGFTKYHESQVGFAYAKTLGKVDVGIKFNYYSVGISGYGTASNINFEAGTIAQLTSKLFAGFEVYNPLGGTLGKTTEKLRSIYKFGMGYEGSDRFFTGMEIVKEEDVPVNVNVGFQYFFIKQFYLKAGIATETTNTYCGAGLSWKNMRLDISVSYHPQLGFSPGLMVQSNFPK